MEREIASLFTLRDGRVVFLDSVEPEWRSFLTRTPQPV
jgi:hypothetical protein